jgi:hypothetical protein
MGLKYNKRLNLIKAHYMNVWKYYNFHIILYVINITILIVQLIYAN